MLGLPQGERMNSKPVTVLLAENNPTSAWPHQAGERVAETTLPVESIRPTKGLSGKGGSVSR